MNARPLLVVVLILSAVPAQRGMVLLPNPGSSEEQAKLTQRDRFAAFSL